MGPDALSLPGVSCVPGQHPGGKRWLPIGLPHLVQVSPAGLPPPGARPPSQGRKVLLPAPGSDRPLSVLAAKSGCFWRTRRACCMPASAASSLCLQGRSCSAWMLPSTPRYVLRGLQRPARLPGLLPGCPVLRDESELQGRAGCQLGFPPASLLPLALRRPTGSAARQLPCPGASPWAPQDQRCPPPAGGIPAPLRQVGGNGEEAPQPSVPLADPGCYGQHAAGSGALLPDLWPPGDAEHPAGLVFAKRKGPRTSPSFVREVPPSGGPPCQQQQRRACCREGPGSLMGAGFPTVLLEPSWPSAISVAAAGPSGAFAPWLRGTLEARTSLEPLLVLQGAEA